MEGCCSKDCIDVIHQKRNEKQHEKGSRMEIKYLKRKIRY
jgi:hypothetical protein